MAKQVRSVAILSVASTVLSVVAGLSQPTPVQLAWQNNQGAIIVSQRRLSVIAGGIHFQYSHSSRHKLG